jgi:hypothetical protein
MMLATRFVRRHGWTRIDLARVVGSACLAGAAIAGCTSAPPPAASVARAGFPSAERANPASQN